MYLLVIGGLNGCMSDKKSKILKRAKKKTPSALCYIFYSALVMQGQAL